MTDKPTFYEFFAGGGMARLGLEPDWRCLFANDVDPMKCAAYRANFGGDDLVERDVSHLSVDDLPGHATLAWASFPCQDLSLAGARRGIKAARSGTFWAFWFLMQQLAKQNRAPELVVIENVTGLLTSKGGADFTVLCEALAEGGYHFSAHILDAADFAPQSRPRLFVVGSRRPPPSRMGSAKTGALQKALDQLPPATAAKYVDADLPAPPGTNLALGDVLEDDPQDVRPMDAKALQKLLSMMTPRNRARVDMALKQSRATGAPVAGAVFRRMRPGPDGGSVQRAEIRLDRAGCLRTPAGGSSRQIVLIAQPDGGLSGRLLSPRETARLMGLPDSYILPAAASNAYKLTGDGVATPVAAYLARNLLYPLALTSKSRDPVTPRLVSAGDGA